LLNASTGELVYVPYAQAYTATLWGTDSLFLWYLGIEGDAQGLYRFNVTTQEATWFWR
jgi:hypothetical protein